MKPEDDVPACTCTGPARPAHARNCPVRLAHPRPDLGDATLEELRGMADDKLLDELLYRHYYGDNILRSQGRAATEAQTRMKPGLFEWEKCGRSWVARVGKLDLTVVERGSREMGRRWRVGEVLGHRSFSSDWHHTIEPALLEAEDIAVREAVPALQAIARARS